MNRLYGYHVVDYVQGTAEEATGAKSAKFILEDKVRAQTTFSCLRNIIRPILHWFLPISLQENGILLTNIFFS